jgi:hypothetical protein
VAPAKVKVEDKGMRRVRKATEEGKKSSFGRGSALHPDMLSNLGDQ